MLNINAFFEFKQRTRHIHSFQLAQLIYHAQHMNDYYTLPQIITTESNRRPSIPPSDESVSIFLKKKICLFYSFFLCDCNFIYIFYLAIFLEMVISNTISNVKCKEKKTRAETSVVCFVVCVCVCVFVC